MELRIDDICRVLREAGASLMEKHEFGVRSKGGDNNFVTDEDVRMQELLRVKLGEIMPEAAFLGEEDMSAKPAPGQYYWLVDPIDGTTNFMHGMRMSCIAAALCRDGEVEAGFVYHPWGNELFYAEKGKGAFLNGEPIKVSHRPMSESLVCIGQGYGLRVETAGRMLPVIAHCYMNCRAMRALGSAEIMLCYVAAGRIDLYVEQAVAQWDHAAGGLIVREAGGTVENWAGKAPSMTGLDSLNAGNSVAQAEMARFFRESGIR